MLPMMITYGEISYPADTTWEGILDILGTGVATRCSEIKVEGQYWVVESKQHVTVSATNETEYSAMMKLPRSQWKANLLLTKKFKRAKRSKCRFHFQTFIAVGIRFLINIVLSFELMLSNLLST